MSPPYFIYLTLTCEVDSKLLRLINVLRTIVYYIQMYIYKLVYFIHVCSWKNILFRKIFYACVYIGRTFYSVIHFKDIFKLVDFIGTYIDPRSPILEVKRRIQNTDNNFRFSQGQKEVLQSAD